MHRSTAPIFSASLERSHVWRTYDEKTAGRTVNHDPCGAPFGDGGPFWEYFGFHLWASIVGTLKRQFIFEGNCHT